MSTRAIRTSTQQTACDVCGRTLLRGERAEIYLSGADRRSVCELCTSRALHGGWVREGDAPAYDEASSRADRRRSLLRRRRPRNGAARPAERPVEELGPIPVEPTEPPLDVYELDREPEATEPAPDWPEAPARPERRPRRRRSGRLPSPPALRDAAGPREPRHVRAVPTSMENKIAAAIELFNRSEHPKTVSGIARSLGLPDVSVHPADPVASMVTIVCAWELCWYRYEVDLSDEVPSVRTAGQGYELAELSELEMQVNAGCDDRGRLDLG